MRQEHALFSQIRGHLPRGTQLSEFGKDQGNRLTNRFVSHLNDAALVVMLIANRHVRAQRAASCGFPQATVQSRTNQVEFDLTDRPFEPEQQPVIETARMIETIGIGDERIDEATQVQQVVPITVVAGHARDFGGHDDADVAQSHLSDESIESDASYASTATTYSKVFIDHHDLRSRPAQVGGPLYQAILQALALSVVQDLAGRGLTNVDRGLASEVGGRDLRAAHGRRSICANQRMSRRASTCSASRCTSGGRTSQTSSGHASSGLGGSSRGWRMGAMLDCGKGLTSRFDASCLAASLLAFPTRRAAMPAATYLEGLHQLAELTDPIAGQHERWAIVVHQRIPERGSSGWQIAAASVRQCNWQ